MKTWRAQLAGAVLIVLMALALGLEASHLPHRVASSADTKLISVPVGHHSCSQASAISDNTGLTQAPDGSFSACLRVGSVAAGAYQVAARRVAGKPPTTLTANAPGDSITLTPPSGPPGTVVSVTGYVAGTTLEQRRFEHAQLCWAACDALAGSVAIDWSASHSGQFTTQFTAPATPWFSGGAVAPLRPGRYAVLFPCLPAFEKPGGQCSGRTLASHFDLTGAGSGLCTGGGTCAVVQTSPAQGPPGTLIAVDGWAPLTGLNGTGFIDLAIEGGLQGKPGFGSAIALVASAPFTVTPAYGWAGLPPMHPVTIQRTGMDPIGVDPGNPRRFAYCGSGAIKITTNAGTTWSTISIAGVRTASAPTNYPIPGPFTTSPVSCTNVALDARYPGTIYAVFGAVPRTSAPPPFYFVAYVSRNSGRSWQPLPVPAKSEMGLFGGFRAYPSATAALFWSKSARDSGGPDSVAIQQTLDGGRTWQPGTLRCPSRGPCISLGAQDNGRCGAVGEWQAIETSSDGGRSWKSPGWPDRLNACGTSQLIGLDSGGVAALDPLGPYTLTLAADGGSNWEVVTLPRIPGADVESGNLPGALEMLPDGRLLLAGTTWYLLGAGANEWCAVRGAPPIQNGQWSAGPVAIGDRLWFDGGAALPAGISTKSFPISAVHC